MLLSPSQLLAKLPSREPLQADKHRHRNEPHRSAHPALREHPLLQSHSLQGHPRREHLAPKKNRPLWDRCLEYMEPRKPRPLWNRCLPKLLWVKLGPSRLNPVPKRPLERAHQSFVPLSLGQQGAPPALQGPEMCRQRDSETVAVPSVTASQHPYVFFSLYHIYYIMLQLLHIQLTCLICITLQDLNINCIIDARNSSSKTKSPARVHAV